MIVDEQLERSEALRRSMADGLALARARGHRMNQGWRQYELVSATECSRCRRTLTLVAIPGREEFVIGGSALRESCSGD